VRGVITYTSHTEKNGLVFCFNRCNSSPEAAKQSIQSMVVNERCYIVVVSRINCPRSIRIIVLFILTSREGLQEDRYTPHICRILGRCDQPLYVQHLGGRQRRLCLRSKNDSHNLDKILLGSKNFRENLDKEVL